MNEQIQSLVEKARRYLGSAELLSAHGDYDSATSRLYYAMFYCAEALLLTRGLKYSSHRGVISAFGQYFVKTGELPAELHVWLREAFDKRQQGDYLAVSSLDDEDFQDLNKKAERFIDQADTFLRQGGFL